MANFVLSGFADEIGPDLGGQLDCLSAEGIRFLELRRVDNRNVTQLTLPELKSIYRQMSDRGVQVSCIGSPVGKLKISEPFEPQLDLFKHCCEAAGIVGCKSIRIFSCFPPDTGWNGSARGELERRLTRLIEWAEQSGVVCLHENERGTYGESPEACEELHRRFDRPAFRMAFDFGNFVMSGVNPFDTAWSRLRPWIEYLHIKDARFAAGDQKACAVPAGEGDGQIAACLGDLMKSDREWVLSLEPHLAYPGSVYGPSGPERFKRAAGALKELLGRIGASWR